MQKTTNEALERLDVAGFKAAQKTPLILILDNIRSLNNIGSVFRTADAFLVTKIYLCGITAQPPHKDINKTALGATETVAWEYRENTLELVKELQAQSIAVWSVEQAQGATFLDKMSLQPETTYALIFGNEYIMPARQKSLISFLWLLSVSFSVSAYLSVESFHIDRTLLFW